MQFEHATLTLAAKRAGWIIERRNAIPIMTHVLFQSGRMIASDLDLTLTQYLSNDQGALPVTASLPALTAALAVAEPGDIITLEPVGGFAKRDDKPQARLSAGGLTVGIDRLPPEDFPIHKSLPGELNPCHVPAPDLRAWLAACRRSVSDEGTRPYLHGIYMHGPEVPGKPSYLTMVSTDGHRLGKVATGMLWPFPGVILPTKAVDVLLRLLDKARGSISVRATMTGVEFAGADWRLDSKVIDGTFPDYTRIIPRTCSTGMTLDPALLLKPVGKLLALAKQSDSEAACKVYGASQTLTIAGDVDAYVTVALPMLAEPVAFGVNLAYLRDLLTTLQEAGAMGRLSQEHSGDPIRIEAVSDSFPGELLLVQMPMRA